MVLLVYTITTNKKMSSAVKSLTLDKIWFKSVFINGEEFLILQAILLINVVHSSTSFHSVFVSFVSSYDRRSFGKWWLKIDNIAFEFWLLGPQNLKSKSLVPFFFKENHLSYNASIFWQNIYFFFKLFFLYILLFSYYFNL